MSDLMHSMPCDAEAEKAVLGCLMKDPENLMPVARQKLTIEHFYKHAHQAIFREMQNLWSESGELDHIMLNSALREIENMSPRALMDLADDIPTVAMFPGYVDVLVDKFTRRVSIRTLEERIKELYDPASVTPKVLQGLAEYADKVTQANAAEDNLHSISQVLVKSMDEIHQAIALKGELPGISYGLDELDERTNGLQPGQMVVIAAYPGVGKTALGFQFLQNMAEGGHPVAAFSAEMLASDIGIRLLARKSKINGLTLKRGQLRNHHMPKLSEAGSELMQLPIHIDDGTNMDMAAIQAGTSRLVRHHKTEVVLVDYIQLLKEDKSARSREDAVRETSRALKDLAKKHKIGVIVLSQLNDSGQMRDSRAIEQDADVILKIKPDEEAMERGEEKRPVVLSVQKCRSGNPGPIDLLFDAPRTQFIPANHPENNDPNSGSPMNGPIS